MRDERLTSSGNRWRRTASGLGTPLTGEGGKRDGFRNRKHYIKLMFIFALISEIPFDIGFFSRYSIALFLGLVALTCLEKFSSISAKRTDKIRGIILQIISVAVIGIIAELFRCDYGLEGILYIAAFYQNK